MENKISLFLDSGAYSAWKQNIKINLQDYIDFIKENQNNIDYYACLDVIGDPKQTYKNQLEMEKQGLDPIITFHNGEDYKWLELYMERYDYIAIGGMAGSGDSIERLRSRLDHCFNMVCDTPDRLPKVKVHGFGMTTFDLIFRYPWYSLDSTSWVLQGRFGGVYVPRQKNGRYVYYNETPYTIFVSDRSPRRTEQGKHFQTLSSIEKDNVLKYFHFKGFEIEELASDYAKRDELNIIYFLEVENSVEQWPWAFNISKRKGLGL